MAAAKPLDQFYKDCLRVGSLKCFTHFHLYLKGGCCSKREALIRMASMHDGPANSGALHDPQGERSWS